MLKMVNVKDYLNIIPKGNLRYLNDYSFNSCNPTYLDVILDRYYWTPMMRIVPMSIAPNVLTLMGGFSMLAFYYIIFTKIPKFDCYYMPKSLLLWVSLFILLYLTLDGIDGKQARRLGMSSPLGQLLDHGIDAMVTGCYGFVALCFVPGGVTPLILTFALGATLHLYFIIWREEELKQFSSAGGLFGVSEAHLSSVLLMCFTYFAEPNILKKTVFTFSKGRIYNILKALFPSRHLTIVQFIALVVLLLTYCEVIYALIYLARKSRDKVGYAIFISSALVHSVPGYILLNSLPLKMKLFGILFASSMASIFAINNIICILAKTRLRPCFTGLIFHYIFLAHAFYNYCIKYFRIRKLKPITIEARNYDLYLKHIVYFGYIYIFIKFSKTVYEIVKHLNIPVFRCGSTIGSKPKMMQPYPQKALVN